MRCGLCFPVPNEVGRCRVCADPLATNRDGRALSGRDAAPKPSGATTQNATATDSTTVGPVDVRELLRALETGVVARPETEPWAGVLPVTGEGEWQVWPLRDGDTVSGFVAVPATSLDADPPVGTVAQRLVHSVSVALGNLRALTHERSTALMLQRSLLPSVLPEPTGLSIAARYRASERHAEVGGDFFDAFETDDGRCFIVIGDIQGHSLEAAVVMAELRYSLRAYAHDGYGPTDILERLDALLLRRDTPEPTATACIAVVSADRSSLEVVTAGHLPPLLVRAGEARYLDCAGPLLGLQVEASKPMVVSLHSGDRLLLMTDGLVELRHEPIDVSMHRLAVEVAQSPDLDVDSLADQLLHGWGRGEDDIALLVVHRG